MRRLEDTQTTVQVLVAGCVVKLELTGYVDFDLCIPAPKQRRAQWLIQVREAVLMEEM